MIEIINKKIIVSYRVHILFHFNIVLYTQRDVLYQDILKLVLFFFGEYAKAPKNNQKVKSVEQ